jgi:hypothetical protein
MRASATASNQPLEEYTLMPTHMDHRFAPSELRDATLEPPLPFSKNVPVLRLPARAMGNPHAFGTLLFDLASDPEQTNPLRDAAIERRMARMLVEAMRANQAPASQYRRLGLSETGDVGDEHLLIERQWPQIEAGLAMPRRTDQIADYCGAVRLCLNDIARRPALARQFQEILGISLAPALLERFGHLTPWHLTFMMPEIGVGALRRFGEIALCHAP